MKILYISGAQGPDYLCDMLFHGLREHFGAEVVDINRLGYMYKGAETKGLYGKGFTLYGLIDEGEVDRSDIPAKLQSRYFDYVVFGSIQREYAALGEVRKHYSPSQILLIDGEDNPLVMRDCIGWGVYFKRELHSEHPKVNPIQFAIPAEKITPVGCQKQRLFAKIDPLDTSTYVYDDEASYYDGYRHALFGKTTKKAGWDCLRHYEIMACDCMPYFSNLEYCPPSIMVNLPKTELMLARQLCDYKTGRIFESTAGQVIWADLMDAIHQHLQNNLTTKALATYVIDTARKAA